MQQTLLTKALRRLILGCSRRLKEQNSVRESKPRDLLESSSDSEEKIPAKPLSLSKRKLELENETVEKKKKGRPRKDNRLMPVTLTVQVAPGGGGAQRGHRLSRTLARCPDRGHGRIQGCWAGFPALFPAVPPAGAASRCESTCLASQSPMWRLWHFQFGLGNINH